MVFVFRLIAAVAFWWSVLRALYAVARWAVRRAARAKSGRGATAQPRR